MRRVKWLMVLMLLVFFVPAFSQNRMANWVFGDSLIVTFTDSGPELSLEKSAMIAAEAAACISDTVGNLLFYSNNIGVWNRLHQPLEGSEELNSASYEYGSSKTNGTLFLPVSGDTSDSKFWVFITDETNHKLRYSLIDRNLDGGLGGIVDGKKNLPVWDRSIGEQLTAVKHGNGRDWWVLSRSEYLNSYVYLYALFTPNGLFTTSQSDTLVPFGSLGGGEMKASVQGDKVGQAVPDPLDNDVFPHVLVFNFDRCSGFLSLDQNYFGSTLSSKFYSIEFSEDGTNIFSGTFYTKKMYKLNISSSILSDTLFFESEDNRIGQLEYAPDNNIYFTLNYFGGGTTAANNSKFLYRISKRPAVEDDYFIDTFRLDLGEWNYTASLPNFANYDLGPLVGSPCDTLSPQDTTQTGIFHPSSASEDWSVFPTISPGLYTLQGDKAGWLIIHDLYGREVLRLWHEERTAFDLTAHPAGLYLVHLRAADGKRSLPQKIIRQ